MYGNPALNRKMHKVLKINRQLLHCSRYEFYDPFVNRGVAFKAALPQDFQTVLDK